MWVDFVLLTLKLNNCFERVSCSKLIRGVLIMAQEISLKEWFSNIQSRISNSALTVPPCITSLEELWEGCNCKRSKNDKQPFVIQKKKDILVHRGPGCILVKKRKKIDILLENLLSR